MAEEILHKALSGGRLDQEEGARLLQEADFLSMGMAAREMARRRQAELGREGVATFVVDRNINYTNVCVAHCSFCAFYRKKGAEDAYVLDYDVILQKIQELADIGGTQILMQGGLNPDLPFDWYLDLLRTIRERFPQVDIHSFSAPEIQLFARRFRLPLTRVLGDLKEAGLASLPGGGAEILVDRVRKAISPGKIGWQHWAAVMYAAAEVGLKATATMMFGHVETMEERVLHLDRVRQIQEDTKGAFPDGRGVFRAFIPWTYQSENTELQVERQATAYEYLRMVSASRLYLDNVDNLQASWVTMGPKIGQISLAFGCNDMGGTMMEENVVRQAGASHRMDRAGVIQLVRDAGYTPAQRNTAYELLEIYRQDDRQEVAL